MTEKLSKNKPDIFNFLRFFALFCVLGTHSRIVISSNLPRFQVPDSFSTIAFTPAWIAMGIFFLLSGYLLGKGFYKGKYKTDLDGILSFWLSRLIRILPMYLLALIIAFLFINPTWFFMQNIKVLISLLTFTYNGTPGIDAVGALWFISTIFQLYLLAPIVYKFIISKIKKYHVFVFIFLLLLGLSFRLIAYKNGLDWYSKIYTPSWMNLDYFFGGMLLNSITRNSYNSVFKNIMKLISLCLLFSLTAGLMLLYKNNDYFFYQYIAPTVTIIIVSLIIFVFDTKDRVYSTKLTFMEFIKNPLRIIDLFAVLSFGIYLYHSYLFSIMPKLMNIPSIFPVYISNGRTLFIIYTFTLFILFIWAAILYLYIEKPANAYRLNISIIPVLKEKIRQIRDTISSCVGGVENNITIYTFA